MNFSNEMIIQRIKTQACFQKIMDFLPELNFPWAIIKGEVLSLQAYGAIGKRYFTDTDLLVSRDNIRRMQDILLSKGFESKNLDRIDLITMYSFSHQTASWKKTIDPIGDIEVDLNFDIFWGEYLGKRVNIDVFLSDCIEIELYGISVKTLPPLKSMVQLILHHYKEMNSIYHLAGHKCIKYNMFKDLYYLWKNNKEAISLEKLYTISYDYGIIPFVYYVLYYTNQIFHDAELSKIVKEFKTIEGQELLNYYGLSEKERKLWKYDFLTRLNTNNLFELIKDDLSDSDMEKLKSNKRLFG